MAGQYTVGALEWTLAASTVAVRCSSQSEEANAVISVDDTGSVYDQAMSLTNFDPTGAYTSKNLENILGAIAINGTCFGSSKTIKSVQSYYRKLETCVDTLSSTSHLKVAYAAGLLRLQTLTADRNSDATITFGLDAFSVAGAAPAVVTDGLVSPVSLPTIAATAGRFRLGLCKIAGENAPFVEGISIDYNVSTTEKEPAFGSIYSESIGVLQAQPRLTIRGRDLSQLATGATFALGATPGTHLNMLLQLIKLKDGESFEDFGDNEHITMTMDGLITPETIASASTGGRATNQLTMRLRDDGTNAPIVTTINTTYETNPAEA